MFLFVLLACAGLFIEPEEGTYTVEVDDIDIDSACGEIWGLSLEDDEIETDVEIGKGTMELDDTVDCDLDGAVFDCAYENEEPVDGYDATIVFVSELEGVWTSNTTFEADVSMEYSCAGADCGDLSTDCGIEMTWNAELD